MKTLSLHTLFIISILSINLTHASSIISGFVVDDQDSPLPYVNVLLLSNQDSSLIKGEVTDENGAFYLDHLSPGSYIFEASMIGYKSIRISLEISDQEEMDLGRLSLSEDVVQLSEVEITARKPLFEQKIDRLVVNVQNSITSAGGSALEVLEKSPGVIVNRQNNAISMNGKNGVVIMINDKESRMPLNAAMQMLQSMPAENIEKIELLSTPPAKFDAEGNAGFINIVLKKNENYGTNGSFSLNSGYGGGPRFGGSINFNHRSGILNLYGDYSYARNFTDQIFEGSRSVNYNQINSSFFSISERDPVTTLHNARLGFDLELGSKTILGGLLSGYNSKWEMDAFNDIDIRKNGIPTTTMGIANDEINHWKHYLGNLNVSHQIKNGERISFDLDYLYYHDDNPTNYRNEIFEIDEQISQIDLFRSSKETPIHFWVGKVDYTKNIGKTLKFDLGIKSSFSRFENDVRVENQLNMEWISDPRFTQFVTLQEDILATYGSFQYDINSNFTISGGLRYEYTTSNLSAPDELDIVDRKYGEFYPTLYLSQKFSDHHSIQFSYNRRITRPTFNDLAPFIIFTSPFSFVSGNSALQPAISNTLKTDFRLKSILLSASFTHEDEAIAGFQSTVDLETNIETSAAQNLDFVKTWNLVVSFPVYFTSWWEGQHSAMVFWQHLKAIPEGKAVHSRQRTLNFNTTQSFMLPGNFSFELSGFYRSASLFGYSIMQPLGSVNLGFQKKFNDDSNLRLAYNDIFRTNEWKIESRVPALGLDSKWLIYFGVRSIMLTYSRNFGSQKVKKARQRGTGSEEERKRIN